MDKSILITGGAGFVGSSLSLKLKESYPQYRVCAFDNLRRRGSELNLDRLKTNGVEFIHGDTRNPEDFGSLPRIDLIIDASAEPSVMAGISGASDYAINSNLVGTINCLNFATRNSSDLIFLSTSRVYPIEKIEQINFVEDETRFSITPDQTIPGISINGISESFPLEGYRSIYGATKLCSELLIEEYNNFYGLKTVANRFGVVTGPWQMGRVDQGVVVYWLAKHFWGGPLSYVGYGGAGKQIRDILHINDLFRLIDFQIHNIDKVNNQVFNVGGGTKTTVSLLELTLLCSKITGNKIPVGSIPETRPADIRIYATDNAKVSKATGWEPTIGIERILDDIYEWIVDHHTKLENILE
jgi:CDP-paratose 2-epimerase